MKTKKKVIKEKGVRGKIPLFLYVKRKTKNTIVKQAKLRETSYSKFVEGLVANAGHSG